jgi:membrane protein involved in colicin uptake
MAARKRKVEGNRQRAGALREEARESAPSLQKREAHARETEAEAAAARAEAERKQAEAQRLAAEAEERRNAAAAHRDEHEERLRRADELDPDVDTRNDDYTGPGTTGGTDTPGRTDMTGDSQTTGATLEDVGPPGPVGSGAEGTRTPEEGTGDRTVEGTTTDDRTRGPDGGSHRA